MYINRGAGPCVCNIPILSVAFSEQALWPPHPTWTTLIENIILFFLFPLLPFQP